jgi:hypothetical protein
MREVERLRQPVNVFPAEEDILHRAHEGWKLVAVEWERPAPITSGQRKVEVPFGLKVSEDCRYLEEDALEMEVLTNGMELMISECPFTRIADELNHKGFRTRNGEKWTPVSVFNLLPRLIEVGPRIFPTEDWVERRKKIYAKAGMGAYRESL